MDNLEFPRVLTDPLYGEIRLTDEEMQVIDSPAFQRLHFIRQTGLLCDIWPNANHTRFVHSIGVLQASQLMLTGLETSSRGDVDKLYGATEAIDGQAIRYHQLPDELRSTVRRLVRLCALVHDLGHGPFSHAFAKFAPRCEDIATFLGDPRLSAIAPYKDIILAGKHGRVEHEAVSCILFADLWLNLAGPSWIPSVVAAVLLHAEPGPFVPLELQPWVPFIRDLIASGPVDADRLDYLRRDSAILGVDYGSIDPTRILKSILCVRVRKGDRWAYRLGWRASGLRVIESAVYARFQMFAQVYRHKTLRAIELMLDDVAEEASRAGENPMESPTTLERFVSNYLLMSDEVFLRMLAGQLRPGFPRSERVRETATRLLERRLWKRIFDFNRNHTAAQADAVMAALRREFPESRFILRRSPLRPVKDLDRGALLVGMNSGRMYEVGDKPLSWFEEAPIIRTLRDEELEIASIFVEPRRARNRDKARAIQKVIHDTLAEPSESA